MRYPGGKGKCFQQLINLMPPHRVYVETHLGGGACMVHKRPAAINIGIDRDARVIERWRAELPEKCDLLHGDAETFLQSYRFVGDELVYADPPYLPSTRRRPTVYRHDYTVADHVELMAILKTLPCMVMVSGYENGLYAGALADWRRTHFTAMTHRGPRVESVWMNFAPPSALHDARFIGETFRHRQNVRRRHERLFRKFDAMKSAERRHLLSVLSRRFGSGEVEQ